MIESASKGSCIKKSKYLKIGGGNNMKKKMNNKKGFSLVELLIVLAILAIIAAISISIFANVLENQRVKADNGQAAYIQSAIQTYLTESDDVNLQNLDETSLASIVSNLKNTINFNNTEFGPYIKSDYNVGVKSKKFKGFDVNIDISAQSVEVKTSTTGNTCVTY